MSEREPDQVFDIIRPIGAGGQADVFLVRLRHTGAVYAAKFLREAWDPIAREEFRREGLRQHRVRGRHVVPIVAMNHDAPQPFIVLEYMPQGSLAEELQRKGRMGGMEALVAARQIAVALSESHMKGVVHRDLKPGNIMCAEDGRLTLNDFGVAATMTTGSVRTTGFVGTPAYAAPEQRDGNATPKSDVFSLGVILYELVLGFPGPITALPSEVRGGDLMRAIDGLIVQFLSPHEQLRPTAAEAVALIDGVIAWSRTTAAPPSVWVPPAAPPPAPRASNGVVGALIAIGLLLGAAWLGGGKTWDAGVGRFRGPNGRFKSG